MSFAADHELVPAVIAGWEHFVETVPYAIADTVLSTLRQPEDLAAVLASGVSTLCHGDAWLVNMAITRNEVVLLDWNLATHGPASLDFVDFVVGCAAHIDLPDDVVLSKARDACRDLVEDTVWHATLLWALCELGWNKALDATTHPDHNERARARRELQWWVEQADRALQTMSQVACRATLRNRPTLERERQGIRGELDRDLSARASGIASDPPDHVLGRLGPRPDHGAAADLWDEAAARLDQHRTAFDVDDRYVHLGRSWSWNDTPEVASSRAASKACDRLDRSLGRAPAIEPPHLELGISL